jgi:hypothetical protein
MSAVAAPPTTRGGLRERVEALAHELDAALKPYDEPSTRDLRNDAVSRKRRVSERDRWFERVNLTLFGGRIEQLVEGLPLPHEPVGGTNAPWLPAILLTDRGAPTPFAMERTCYRSAHHRTLAEWRADERGRRPGRPAGRRPRRSP